MREVLERGDLRLGFERTGAEGDPTVLVHGGWEDGRAWERVVRGLSSSLQVLVYDRRGHGSSSSASPGPPVRKDASDLAQLLESTGLFPAHVLALGEGGTIALRLAVDRPELVRSVAVHEIPSATLLDLEVPSSEERGRFVRAVERLRGLVGAGQGEEAARGYLEAFAAPAEQWPLLDDGARRYLRSHAEAWSREMADPEAFGLSLAELRGLAIPVLSTTGGSSPGFARRIDDRLADAVGNGTSLHLSDGGHFVHRTDPDLYVGVLGGFLLERNVPTT